MSVYYILLFPFWLLAFLPLRILYLLSDILYPVLYLIVRYRRAVVRSNIEKSFPEKAIFERRKIERQFYRFFCDMLVETFYQIHISENEIQKRFTYENIELLEELHDQGKCVMVMTAHHTNWEWGVGIPLHLKNDHIVRPIYKRQKNRFFNTLICRLRERFGARVIEKKELLREMIRVQKANEIASYWMVSDQTPNARNLHCWMNFLNQDTAVVTGTEQLARKFNYPVIYAEFSRVKRGYYHCRFLPVELNPSEGKDYEITERYMHMLEATIKSQPQYWLWSHKRWKHNRK